MRAEHDGEINSRLMWCSVSSWQRLAEAEAAYERGVAALREAGKRLLREGEGEAERRRGMGHAGRSAD